IPASAVNIVGKVRGDVSILKELMDAGEITVEAG
ncbi:MAG: hypothetical protein JRH00_16460, partial [Deltaproteobacteria bacterium]|nr:hypothetical protein [Deltaproteobacteria bacterium]